MNGASRFFRFFTQKNKFNLIWSISPHKGFKSLNPFLWLLLLVLVTGFFNRAEAQSFMVPSPGYQAEDVLPQWDEFSTFDVRDNLLYANTGAQIKGFNLETGETFFTTDLPGDYAGFPSFLTLSPQGSHLWAGYTTSGNTDDRIYRIDLQSGAWHLKAELAANHDLIFWQEHLLVSGLNEPDWSLPASIFLLDTLENNHTKVIEIGGSTAGLSKDHEDNVYFGTYFFSDDNALYRWDSDDINNVLENEAPFLGLDNAHHLSGLPGGAYDCHVDKEGHVLFNVNGSETRFLARWNGISGDDFNYDTLAIADDSSDWLTTVKSDGNISQVGPGNGAFMLAFGRPVARIHREQLVDISQPVENVMAYEDEETRAIDLDAHFETSGEDFYVNYEMAVHSDPAVLDATIDGSELLLNFSEPGQTNLVVRAVVDDQWVSQAFVVGVMPVIDGDYVVSGLENLELEQEGFWNGSDESGGFNSGLAFFTNNYNVDWSSWSGWAYSNISDNTTPGWANQYSAITGEAMNAATAPFGNYAITYVQGQGTLLHWEGVSSHQPKGFFVTNSTYAALAMKYGDDFSKKFGGETGDDPDWFKLSVLGWKDGIQTDTIDYYLADYRFEDNTQNYIIETWQWVELSTLGKIDSLSFSLSSSDVGEYGMNTPAYFALDHLYVVPDQAPYVANPIEDLTVDENAEDYLLDVSQVFSDPDDSDEEMEITVKEISNPGLLETSVDEFMLTLTFTPDMTGESTITLEALSNGKTVEESFTVTVQPVTSIAENNPGLMRIFPNPFKDVFQIDYRGHGTLVVHVYNPKGQKVYSNITGKGVRLVDLDHLPAGVYIVKGIVRDGESKYDDVESHVFTRKVLKRD